MSRVRPGALATLFVVAALLPATVGAASPPALSATDVVDGDPVNESTNATNTSDATDAVVDAVNDTGDAVNDTGDAVDDTGDALNDTGDAVTNATRDVVNATNTTVNTSVSANASVGNGSVNASAEVGTTRAGTTTSATTRTTETSTTGTHTTTATTGQSTQTTPTAQTTTANASAASSAGGRDSDAGGDGPLDGVPGGPSGAAAVGVGVAAAAAASKAAGSGATVGPTGASTAARTVLHASHIRLSGWTDRALRVLGLFGYSRWDDSDPLDHETRDALYDAVTASPGAYLSELDEEVDPSLASVRHHLRVLEDERLVASAKLRGRRRYFPIEADPEGVDPSLASEGATAVLEVLARLGPASVSTLAAELDRDPSTVSHHLSRLDEDGLVERERDGRVVLNSLTPEARTALSRAAPASAGDLATAGGAD